MRSQLFLFLFPFAVSGQFLDRPNVVLFMADDMGMGDSSAYQFFTGNSDGQQIHTPAMQKLANMGMLFTDAHTHHPPGARPPDTDYSLADIRGELE